VFKLAAEKFQSFEVILRFIFVNLMVWSFDNKNTDVKIENGTQINEQKMSITVVTCLNMFPE